MQFLPSPLSLKYFHTIFIIDHAKFTICLTKKNRAFFAAPHCHVYKCNITKCLRILRNDRIKIKCIVWNSTWEQKRMGKNAKKKSVLYQNVNVIIGWQKTLVAWIFDVMHRSSLSYKNLCTFNFHGSANMANQTVLYILWKSIFYGCPLSSSFGIRRKEWHKNIARHYQEEYRLHRRYAALWRYHCIVCLLHLANVSLSMRFMLENGKIGHKKCRHLNTSDDKFMHT